MIPLQKTLAEIERLWRIRTPAIRVDMLDPGLRVHRSEMLLVAQKCGYEVGVRNDEFDRALFSLFDRLREEFPKELWEAPNAATRARRAELGLC